MSLKIIKPGTEVFVFNTFEGVRSPGVITGCMVRWDHVIYEVAWWDEGGRCERALERFEFMLAEEDASANHIDVDFETGE